MMQRGLGNLLRNSVRTTLAGLLLTVIVLLHAQASAFTLNVVDGAGNPVTGFRWLVEVDNTDQPTLPGNGVAPAIDGPSVSIHKSHAPVVTQGDTASSSATVDVPADQQYFLSVLPHSGYSNGGAPVAVGQEAVTVTVNQHPLPTAQISILTFVDHAPINNLKDEHDPGLGGCTIEVSDFAGPISQDIFGNPLGTRYQFVDANGNGFHDQGEELVLDPDGNPIPLLPLGNGTITTLRQSDFAAASGRPDDPATPLVDETIAPDPSRNPYNLKVGEALVKYIAPGKYGMVITPPPVDSQGSAIDWRLTSTIEGTETVDAWVKANEPKLFVEGFGTGFNHAFYAFVNPDGSATSETGGYPIFDNPNGATAGLGYQVDAAGVPVLDINGFPFPLVPPLNWVAEPPAAASENGTITGTLRLNHFSRPPNLQGFFAGEPVSEGWIGLNDPAILPGVTLEAGLQLVPSGLYATAADPDTGEFTINNVPPGTYQLVNWDQPLDYLFGVRTVTVGPGETVNLGNVLVFRWFGTFQGSVFLDDGGGNPVNAGNGFRDPGEIGIAEQNVNIRFRDGTIYQFQPTDINGEYEFGEVFPFFKWLVPEVDFARFKATGATNIVDYGGEPVGLTLGGRTLGVGKLAPQPQAEINPNTGDNLSRTEPGEVLTQAMHLFLGQTNIVDWGKAEYGPAENGGISGIVYYAVTRAENDPRLAVGEEWEPGIPRVVVNLYRDLDGNGIIDDLNGDGLPTPADVDNYPFGWQDGGPMGPEDIDHDGDGQWNPGDALNVATSDSWDDNPPSGCIQNLPVIRGQTLPECSDTFGTWNQIRPGVFDGGYAFNSYFPGGMASGNAEVEGGLPTGTYIVEAATPPGYELLKEENKNVDFGDTFTPSPQVIPALCVGEPHTVPQFLTFNSDGTSPLPGVDPADLIEGFFAGQTRPLCNRKQVIAAEAKNAAVDFFYLTQVPKAARAVGFANNDLGAEFNMASPNFGEKLAPSWIPVSFHDWTGREITRVYTDEFGGYNALLPSTYTVNVPSPSGVSPNMLTLILNNPILPDGTRDPHYDPTYSVTPWTFDYWPGKTSYLDTPLVPVTAFAANDILLDTNLPDGTPAIGSIAGNEPEGGALVCTDRANGRTLTLKSAGTVQLRNPAFDAGNINSPLFIQRDFGFGPVVGQVTVTVNGAPEPLELVSWTPEQIVVAVPATLSDGVTPFPVGTYQLTVTRGDNGRTTLAGETISVVNCGAGTVRRVSEDLTPGASPIQDAIDAAADGDLILVGPGTYNENVIMYKPVRLQGAGAGKTFINGNPTPLERLDAWHRRIEAPATDVVDTVNGVNIFGLGGAEFSSFLLKFPFSESETPGIVVIGTIDYPGGNLQVPDNNVTRTFNLGHPFPIAPPADPPRIDGFTISGSKAGGGIFAVTAARFLVISNNEITNNQGNYAGGVAIGTQDSGFDAQNTNIVIRDNHIHANGGVQGPGGVVLNEYANDYLVEDNLIIGNFSRFHGGGIQHRGLVPGNNVIRNNRILFNEDFFNAILARAGDGGGIHIGGDVVAGTGAGNVTIEGNLIQGNMTGSGSGGGIRVFAINADDIRLNPGDPSQWYQLKILNNVIVNNVAGLDGGGISLQDVARPTIINNTIVNNDSTATGILAFEPGASNSVPQPAGIATYVHSPELQDLLYVTAGLDPATEPNFSSPVLVNNIILNNRSFFNDATLSGGQGGLAPNPAGQFWDLGVLGTPGTMSPANCLLTSLTGPDGAVYGASNLAAPAQPVVRRAYFNILESTTILDEGGNNINVRFTPTSELAGDYHLRFGSAAIDVGQAVNTGTFPSLVADVDGQARPNGAGVDIGADEFYPVPPTQVGVWRQGFWYLDQNGNGAWDALTDIQSEELNPEARIPVAGDWDGDGRTEVGFYDQGAWYLDQNGDGVWSGPGVDRFFANFGAATDIPVTGDWNGDGTTQVGVYRQGTWFLDDGDGVWNDELDTTVTNFGAPTDIPVTGNMDGDLLGVTEIGVWRPATGQWFFDADHSGSWSDCQADGGTDLCLTQFGAPDDIPVTGDWDGDGTMEVGTFRQGAWFLDDGDGAWNSTLDTTFTNFGAPTDRPVPGDWDGDGTFQVGTYRSSNKIWFLDNGDGQWDMVNGIDVALDTFGGPSDIPVTGDWDGDGVSTIATFRQGQWFLGTADGYLRGYGSWNGTLVDVGDASFGAPTDLPVAGDWNGDGKTQLGVYRQGQWFLDYNGNRQWDPDLDKAYANFGAPTDIPVAGDMDGNGVTEIGVWRPATGQWFFDIDSSGSWSGCLADGGTDLCLAQFGSPTDLPVTGDWNGDGVDEVGTYRQGTWFLDNGNGVWDDPATSPTPDTADKVHINFGAPTDIPVTGIWQQP